jgi:DNA-binding IscR family transcriptional regulator
MVALAGSDVLTVPANALAEKLDLSYNYLLTIVAKLRRAGFIKSDAARPAALSWPDRQTR